MVKFHTCFSFTNVWERVCGIFLFCLDLEIFKKKNTKLWQNYGSFLGEITQNTYVLEKKGGGSYNPN